jgi:hypothetical protein
MYGDTAVVRARARAMRARAQAMRLEADRLVGHAEAVGWTGLAADAMRRLTSEHAGRLRACADAHEDSADALDRHAREVDHVKQLIATIEHRALGLLDSATSGVAGLIGQVLPDDLTRWAHDFDPPPHGSPEWLDVHVPGCA